MRLCRAALDAGVDLAGAELLIEGEPVTEARLAAIRAAGVRAGCRHAAMESGPIGYWCLAPEAPDEVHLASDLHALARPPAAPGGVPGPFLLSSLRPTAPLILLNVSLGDVAVVTERDCGCPLQVLGWTTHLHTIRSYEKLTVGGMTLSDSRILRALEELLPGRFGGGSADYQLVEDTGGDGASPLRLLVDPRVGPLNAEAMREAFLTALGHGDGHEQVVAAARREARLPEVERRPPHPTATGKILHVHHLG